MSMTTKKTVSGVLLLDKPSDMTSHTALNLAKRLLMNANFNSKKAGHTGTLDPMATGLLPICFGEATKFSNYGLDADKGYKALIDLGQKTDTGDKDGTIIEQKKLPCFTQSELDGIAQAMMGEQLQIPPMYSALKKDGKKLYEYAREGIQIDRPPRPITIYNTSLTKLSPQQVLLTLTCSKGTYVRVIGEQIAERLGTVGHLSALHRTTTGGFDVAQAISLDELECLSFDERLERLLPIDVMIRHLPMIVLSKSEQERIRLGQRLNVKDKILDFDVGDDVLVRLYADEFLGLAQLSVNGRLQPKKIVNPSKPQ